MAKPLRGHSVVRFPWSESFAPVYRYRSAVPRATQSRCSSVSGTDVPRTFSIQRNAPPGRHPRTRGGMRRRETIGRCSSYSGRRRSSRASAPFRDPSPVGPSLLWRLGRRGRGPDTDGASGPRRGSEPLPPEVRALGPPTASAGRDSAKAGIPPGVDLVGQSVAGPRPVGRFPGGRARDRQSSTSVLTVSKFRFNPRNSIP